jgi:hypothetical protein
MTLDSSLTMTRKEWTDDEVQAEIREAVRIVNEDRERATYKSLHERYGKESTDPPGTPPKKEGDADPPEGNKKSKSLYWGEGHDE